MKIVIAPDSFKESLTAEEVAEAIKRGFQQSIADVECLLCPVGDGGEGTVVLFDILLVWKKNGSK